eukprot:311202-Chlamydomonas_euryale.AAC.1
MLDNTQPSMLDNTQPSMLVSSPEPSYSAWRSTALTSVQIHRHPPGRSLSPSGTQQGAPAVCSACP